MKLKELIQISCLIIVPFFAYAQSVTIEPTLSGYIGNNVEISGSATSSTPLKLFTNNYYNHLRFYTFGGQEQGQIIAESGIIGLNGLGKTTLNVNNSPRLTVNSSGNVGIGNSYDGDTYKLSVKSNSSSIASFLNEDPSGMINLNYNDKHFLQVSPTLTTYYGDTDFQFEAFTNKTFNFKSNGTSRLFIDRNFGNVGIGTTTPEAKLEVNGYTKLGTDAPAVKFKKFTGNTVNTTGNCNTSILLAGITDSKILDFSVLIDWGTNDWVKSGYTISTDPDEEFHVYHKDNEIRICLTTSNSNSLKNKPYKVLVTYEE